MRIATFFISMFIGFCGLKSWAGGNGVGNGGNVVQCVASASNSFAGYYSLDFLLTAPGVEPVPAKSWQQSLKRISDLILEKVPELHASFETFRNEIFNTSFQKAHVWEPAAFGLLKLDDQEIAVRLPENCLENGEIKLIQAVIRLNPEYSGSETQVFKYMPDVIEKLEAQDPLQTSFLLVHEWLWELGKNVDRNRRINRYLQSKAFAEQKPDQVIKELRGMGLELTGAKYATKSIQEALATAKAGETVFLLDRTYREKVQIRQSVHLKAAPGAKPVLEGSISIEANQVSVQGLRIRFDSFHGISVISQSQISLLDNEVTSSAPSGLGEGISLNSVNDAQVIGNMFHSSSTGMSVHRGRKVLVEGNRFLAKVDGLLVSGSEVQIVNNAFESRTWKCMTLYSEDPMTSPILIERNRFSGCDLGVDLGTHIRANLTMNTFTDCDRGVFLSDNKSADISENEFHLNRVGVYDLNNQISAVEISNNKFTNNQVGIAKTDFTRIGANVFENNGNDVQPFENVEVLGRSPF